MPRFVEMERRHGSLIRGLRAAAKGRNSTTRGTSGARWSLFVSFRNGMGALVEALAAQLEGAIRRGAEVVEITRHASGNGDTPGNTHRARWKLGLADGSGCDADAIICCAPAYAAAPLLWPHNPTLAAMLGEIGYASAATVNMIFRASDFPNPLDGFGFVAPIIERRKIIAGSFSSMKFAGRAPDGMVLARVFIGGALQNAMMALDDAAMAAAAREEFAALLGVTATPTMVRVRRWPDAMPQYAVGHLDRAGAIEREAAQLDGLVLAGAYLRGVGIPDCVRSGEAAAEAIFSQLMQRT